MRFQSILLTLLIASQGRVDANQPTEVVSTTVFEVLEVLSKKDDVAEKKWPILAEVLSPTFDFRSLSQTSIDSDWKEATRQDKKKLLNYFSQYLEEIYRTKMAGFVPSKIVYVSEQIRKDRSIVDSHVYSDSMKYLVSYRLKKKEANWYIYDVFLDNESIVDNWKQVYAAIIRSEGLEGLLDKLELGIEYEETEIRNFNATSGANKNEVFQD